MWLGLSMNKQTFELLLPVCLWNILNTCITRCMYLPSQKRNMIHKPAYCCAAKCKTELGNWDKACTGIMQGGLAGERKPPFLLLKLLPLSLNLTSCLTTHFTVRTWGLTYHWRICEPMSVREMGVCAFWVTCGERRTLSERSSQWYTTLSASIHKFTHWALLFYPIVFEQLHLGTCR